MTVESHLKSIIAGLLNTIATSFASTSGDPGKASLAQILLSVAVGVVTYLSGVLITPPARAVKQPSVAPPYPTLDAYPASPAAPLPAVPGKPAGGSIS